MCAHIWPGPFFYYTYRQTQTNSFSPHTCLWAPAGPLYEPWYSEVNGSQVFASTRGRSFFWRNRDLTSLWGLSAGKSGACSLLGPDSLGGLVWLPLVSHGGPGAGSTHQAGGPPPWRPGHTQTTHTDSDTHAGCSAGVEPSKTIIFLIRLFFNLWRQGA